MALTEYEHLELTPVSDIRMGDKIVNVYGSALRPIFRTADVAAALGLQNQKQMIEDLDPDDKGLLKLKTTGGVQKVSFISEFGLYDVLFASRKTIAKDFKRTVKASLFILRMTGKVTASDLANMHKGVCVTSPPLPKGVCNIYPPSEKGVCDIQPPLTPQPSVKILRAEFEFIRQTQKLLGLTTTQVRDMVSNVATKYGLSL